MSRADVLHWTPADYLSEYKVRRLDLQEHGAYMLLLWHMWEATDEQCIFPLNYAVLGGIWGVCPEEAERIADSLMAPGMPLFTIVKRSKVPHLFSKRLSLQAQKAREFRAVQSNKGVRSGAVRRANASNRGSTGVQPNGEPNVNPIEPSLHVTRSPVSRSPETRVKTQGLTGVGSDEGILYTIDYAKTKWGRNPSVKERGTLIRFHEKYGGQETRDAVDDEVAIARTSGPHDDPLAYIGGMLKKGAQG
jgi:uncharacterized protein YdaU (DUF1376 family)